MKKKTTGKGKAKTKRAASNFTLKVPKSLFNKMDAIATEKKIRGGAVGFAIKTLKASVTT